jgi:hypothetical protein
LPVDVQGLYRAESVHVLWTGGYMSVLLAFFAMIRACFSKDQSEARKDMITWNRTF